MDNKTRDDKDPYNEAIAAVLLERKVELGMTFPDLALISGINVQQVMRLVNGHRAIHMGNFVRLTTALDVDPAEVIQLAADRVEKISA